jgi:hypothetical protein
MPLYEYQNFKTGARFTAVVPVDKRDSLPGARRILSTPTVLTQRAANPATTDGRNILKSYHKLEQKHGSRFRSSYTPEQIKRAWSN